MKVFVWLILSAVPFFLPMGAIAGFGARPCAPEQAEPTTCHNRRRYPPLFLPGAEQGSAPLRPIAWVARVLSGVFLVIQMLLVLDFTYAVRARPNESNCMRGPSPTSNRLAPVTPAHKAGRLADPPSSPSVRPQWSDNWVNKEDNRWLAALLASSVASFAGGITIIALSYKWCAPLPGRPRCLMPMRLHLHASPPLRGGT